MERTVGYLEGSFLPLRSFSDICDLQVQDDDWAREMLVESPMNGQLTHSRRDKKSSTPADRRSALAFSILQGVCCDRAELPTWVLIRFLLEGSHAGCSLTYQPQTPVSTKRLPLRVAVPCRSAPNQRSLSNP